MEEVPAPLSPRVRYGLQPDLSDVAEQLHRDFDPITGAETVDRVVDDVASRFIDARVRTFIPLLVHRYAKNDLRSATLGARSAEPESIDAGGAAPQTSSAG